MYTQSETNDRIMLVDGQVIRVSEVVCIWPIPGVDSGCDVSSEVLFKNGLTTTVKKPVEELFRVFFKEDE